MARRLALVVALVVAACLSGELVVHAEPLGVAKAEPQLANRGADVPAPPPPRPEPRAVGTLVATVRPGHVVAVRRAPGGSVVARLSSRTEFGSRRTFAVTAGRGALRVITAELPNGRPGWIDTRQAVRLVRTRITLDADLSTRVLRVERAGRVVRTLRIGIGSPATPTPSGRFAVTDKLRGSDYSSSYGCCILALSGHQTSLPRGWTGGDRLAIHGGSTAGAVSTGCLHAAEGDLRYLMRTVPLGAQIVIHP